MKIVIAETDFLDPEIIKQLSLFGELALGPFSRSELIQELQTADVLMVRLEHQINDEMLCEASLLKVVVTATTGLTHLDLDYLESRNIDVLSLKGEVKFLGQLTATAELTWGLIISLARRFKEVSQQINDGSWDRDDVRGLQLSGKTLGIVGFGRLGKIVSDYANVFRMNILACDPYIDDFPSVITACDLEEVLARSDFVTLHAPANSSTQGMIGAREFGLMKKDAFLINTARGDLVDEAALIEALEAGQLAGAALDTMVDELGAQEAWLPDRKIWQYAQNHQNLILTPHIGGSTIDTLPQAEKFITNKLIRYLEFGQESEQAHG